MKCSLIFTAHARSPLRLPVGLAGPREMLCSLLAKQKPTSTPHGLQRLGHRECHRRGPNLGLLAEAQRCRSRCLAHLSLTGTTATHGYPRVWRPQQEERPGFSGSWEQAWAWRAGSGPGFCAVAEGDPRLETLTPVPDPLPFVTYLSVLVTCGGL